MLDTSNHCRTQLSHWKYVCEVYIILHVGWQDSGMGGFDGWLDGMNVGLSIPKHIRLGTKT